MCLLKRTIEFYNVLRNCWLLIYFFCVIHTPHHTPGWSSFRHEGKYSHILTILSNKSEVLIKIISPIDPKPNRHFNPFLHPHPPHPSQPACCIHDLIKYKYVTNSGNRNLFRGASPSPRKDRYQPPKGVISSPIEPRSMEKKWVNTLFIKALDG